MTNKELLTLIDNFLLKTNSKATHLSDHLFGYKSFIYDVRNGQMPTPQRVYHVERFIAEYKDNSPLLPLPKKEKIASVIHIVPPGELFQAREAYRYWCTRLYKKPMDTVAIYQQQKACDHFHNLMNKYRYLYDRTS